MAKKQRYRIRYPFWLDLNNPDELHIADTIELLKNERSFASTIRDGIMLIVELRQGKTDLLLRLFPWLADALKAAPDNGGDDLKRELSELKQLIRQQQSAGVGGYVMNPGEKQPSAKLDAGSIFIAPSAAEQKASGVDARATFTGGMGNLFAADDDDLWD